MSHTIRYRSSRRELWHWYWRAWKERLWWVHVALAAFIGLAVAYSSGPGVHVGRWLLFTAAAFPLVVVVLASVPQLCFKSAERTLVVGPEGWSTRIGKKSAEKPYSYSGARPDDFCVLCQIAKIAGPGTLRLSAKIAGPGTLRLSSRVSRLLALLRAHRLIRRLPRSHRYVLTTKGHSVATAILAIQSSRIKSLLQEAA